MVSLVVNDHIGFYLEKLLFLVGKMSSVFPLIYGSMAIRTHLIMFDFSRKFRHILSVIHLFSHGCFFFHFYSSFFADVHV